MSKNLIPKIAKMLGVELAKAEDEETYIPGPRFNDALIAAANESIRAFHGVQHEINSVCAARKENTEK